MLDMGFTDDLESILEAHAAEPSDRAFLRDDPAPRSRRSRSATDARSCPGSTWARADSRRARGASIRQPCSWCGTPTSPLRSGACSTSRRRGPRWSSAGRGPRSINSPRRCRRPRLPGRGAARRPGPDATRPRDGAAARRAPPSSSSRPTSPRVASTSSSSTHVVNYDVPSAAGAVHAPHRAHRSGGTRGSGDHAWPSRANVASRQHRETHRAEVRDRQSADRGRPADPPDRDDRQRRPRGAHGGRSRGLQHRPACARGRGQRPQHRAAARRSSSSTNHEVRRSTNSRSPMRRTACAASPTRRSSTRTRIATRESAIVPGRRASVRVAPARASSTSASVARPGCVPVISSGRSRTRPVSSVARSARSGSPTATRSSVCPRRRSTT